MQIGRSCLSCMENYYLVLPRLPPTLSIALPRWFSNTFAAKYTRRHRAATSRNHSVCRIRCYLIGTFRARRNSMRFKLLDADCCNVAFQYSSSVLSVLSNVGRHSLTNLHRHDGEPHASIRCRGWAPRSVDRALHRIPCDFLSQIKWRHRFFRYYVSTPCHDVSRRPCPICLWMNALRMVILILCCACFLSVLINSTMFVVSIGKQSLVFLDRIYPCTGRNVWWVRIRTS